MPSPPESAPGSSSSYLRGLATARARILQFALGSILAAAAVVCLLPRVYTAKVVFLPSEQATRKPPAQMMALAATLGLSLPFSTGGGSNLFPTLLESDRLLEPLLDETFSGDDGSARSLIDWLVAGRGSAERRRDEALRTLREDVVRAHRDAESNLVTLQVTTGSAALSAAVANRLADDLETYLVGSRQEKGRGNREFLTGRRLAAEEALAAAGRALADFDDANRRAGSPAKMRERARLLRERKLRRQLLVEVRQQEEMTRLAETRTTPVARILDPAAKPAQPRVPPRPTIVLLAAALGLLVPVAGVLVRTAATTR